MKPDRGGAGFRVEPFTHLRRQQFDWLELMHRQHTIHALLEVDVTETRRSIREYRSRSGQLLSLTAFVIGCVAQAVDADRQMHAYRRGRSQLVLFDEVDVAVPVERVVEGRQLPVPFIIRAANRKEPAERRPRPRWLGHDGCPCGSCCPAFSGGSSGPRFSAIPTGASWSPAPCW
jgi:hypothetical protein